jgi:transcriptional regulator with XRE-family HTH domain
MSTDQTSHAGSVPLHVRRLRGILAEQGLKQQDVAGWLGLSQAAVSRRMSGAVEFRLDELVTISTLLGVDLGALTRTAA